MGSANAVQSSTVLSRFSSVNGTTFSSTSSNQVRIKIRGNGFLQVDKHYLEFTITTATAAAQIDTHAGSFIDRVRIESNGQIVEELNNYGLFNAIKQNYNTDVNELYKKNAESGSGKLAIKFEPTAIGLAAMSGSAVTNAEVKVVTDAAFAADNGKLFEVERDAAGELIATGDSKVFCIQLESGLLKNAKALPDGLNELDLILTLASDTQAMVSAGAATYTMTNPTLYIPAMRVENNDVMQSYRQVVAQEGVMWSGVSQKSYVNALPLAAGTPVLQINDRSLSCLGFVTAIQAATANATNASYSNGAFGYTDVTGTTKINRFRYIIQGDNFPQSDLLINVADNGLNIARATEESCKALAPMGHNYCDSLISKTKAVSQFDLAYAASPATGGTDAPCALLSVDLKRTSNDGMRMVGMNTAQNSSPSVLELNVSVALAAACTATTYALVESFYQMDSQGGLSSAM
jgi:hypothetical protein